MKAITERELYQFHKRQRDRERKYRYAQLPDPRRHLACTIERDVAQRIAQLGHAVNYTSRGARFDLLVDDCCHIEVKAATWTDRADGIGRYQCHYHNRADMLIFCCVNGSNHYFLIPIRVLAGRRNIAITSYHPYEYVGQWTPYLEAWPILNQVVDEARQRTYQRSLL